MGVPVISCMLFNVHLNCPPLFPCFLDIQWFELCRGHACRGASSDQVGGTTQTHSRTTHAHTCVHTVFCCCSYFGTIIRVWYVLAALERLLLLVSSTNTVSRIVPRCSTTSAVPFIAPASVFFGGHLGCRPVGAAALLWKSRVHGCVPRHGHRPVLCQHGVERSLLS